MINKIAIALTAIVALSTIICGASISGQPTIEASSLSFHTAIGILTVLLSFGTIMLLARSAKTLQ
jgi:hypothetical protein